MSFYTFRIFVLILTNGFLSSHLQYNGSITSFHVSVSCQVNGTFVHTDVNFILGPHYDLLCRLDCFEKWLLVTVRH